MARKADGEVVWSWHLDADATSLGTTRATTVTNKPDHRGERVISRKTIAQGMFWRTKALNINVVWMLCRRLCRDPRKLLIVKKIPAQDADASPRCLTAAKSKQHMGGARQSSAAAQMTA